MNNPDLAHPVLSSGNGKTIPFPTSQASPKTVNKLEALVRLEGQLAALPSHAAVALHAINEPRELLGFDQAIMFRIDRRKRAHAEAVSSLARTETMSPLIRQLARLVRDLPESAAAQTLNLNGDAREPNAFEHGLWVPLFDRKKKQYAGLLFARARPWEESDITIANRLGGSYGLALRAHARSKLLSLGSVPNWGWIAASALAAGLALIPVPMTTLAPVEVVPASPTAVRSPVDGIISEVLVLPNAQVGQGTPLLRFDATVLQSDEQVAAQRVAVAAARLAAAQSGAFSDDDAKSSLPVAERELSLAEVQHRNAQMYLSKINVVAGQAGVATFATRNDLIGKPVRVGEKLMDLADPANIAYRIDLPVHDAIALQESNAVKVFLDADPLNGHEAKITELSYHALPQPDGSLAYRIVAEPTQGSVNPRLGLRGTAQLSGETVQLWFFLFRRPIAAFRQYIGR